MKTECTVYKTKVTHEMIGQYILTPASEEGQEAIKAFPENKRMECKIKYVKKHNLERHDLFFSCIKLVADNFDKSIIYVKEKVKLDIGWVEGCILYDNGKCISMLTKSIAFSEMTIQEANEFYAVAFDKLAEYLGVSTEEMTAEAKKRMKRRY